MTLAFALTGLETFEKSSLAPLEREVLAMTMGRVNGLQILPRPTTPASSSQKAPAHLLSNLEAGQPLADPRLEALRAFILALLERRGDVADNAWTNFREAGYTPRTSPSKSSPASASTPSPPSPTASPKPRNSAAISHQPSAISHQPSAVSWREGSQVQHP